VSMNLTDFPRTPVRAAFEAVRREAEARGVRLLESELIGLIPAAALAGTTPEQLGLTGFRRSQILEERIAERLGEG
jgi:glutamate formiminotransferase / 5-formyltetrahydrofolate cyclo-ligase